MRSCENCFFEAYVLLTHLRDQTFYYRRSNDKWYSYMILTKEKSTTHYKKLVQILGKGYIKAEIKSPFDFIQIAVKGLNP